ncbi:predicted protein [Aspergillus udagawae]|uniref:Cyanovirin-N domain-containing protein n=1 Tax=Aspergillus udagawae TaxID=91492 RepID=A0A8H3P410_9EURO|nr:predicted protein [Aspergillus udagawae]
MSWHMSSRQIPGQPWIYNSSGHTHLQAQCLDEQNNWQNSDLDLDTCIGDENVVDVLVWGEQDFTSESRSVNFAFEQNPPQPILRATFFDGNSAPKNTAERISNINGHLVFQ